MLRFLCYRSDAVTGSAWTLSLTPFQIQLGVTVSWSAAEPFTGATRSVFIAYNQCGK